MVFVRFELLQPLIADCWTEKFDLFAMHTHKYTTTTIAVRVYVVRSIRLLFPIFTNQPTTWNFYSFFFHLALLYVFVYNIFYLFFHCWLKIYTIILTLQCKEKKSHVWIYQYMLRHLEHTTTHNYAYRQQQKKSDKNQLKRTREKIIYTEPEDETEKKDM